MPHSKSYKIHLASFLVSLLALALILAACSRLPGTILTPAVITLTTHPTALLPALTTTRMRASVTPGQQLAADSSSSTATAQQITVTDPPLQFTLIPYVTRAPRPSTGPYDCPLTLAVQTLVQQVQPEPWLAWIRQLSGEEPVTINGQPVTLTTRYTQAMFASGAGPSAFDFVLEMVRGWYPASQIQVQTFSISNREGQTFQAKNLILNLPGTNRSAQTVLLTAHLDDRSSADESMTHAPGADDNASGSAALLEAARLLRDRRTEHPLRLIWFTGEEQGLLGSRAYVQSLPDPRQILGVINLDMFAYDGDQDDLFEVHAGTLPNSAQLAGCFTQTYADSNNLPSTNPPPFDLLTDQAIRASDHGSFWDAGVAAIEISENVEPPSSDFNPNYHSVNDTIDKIDTQMAIRIVRGALAAAASLAGLQP